MNESNTDLAAKIEILTRLHIAEIKNRGGITTADLQRASAVAPELATKGDVLLYGSEKEREQVAGLLDRLSEAVAVLAFLPGGITLFGNHYEAH